MRRTWWGYQWKGNIRIEFLLHEKWIGESIKRVFSKYCAEDEAGSDGVKCVRVCSKIPKMRPFDSFQIDCGGAKRNELRRNKKNCRSQRRKLYFKFSTPDTPPDLVQEVTILGVAEFGSVISPNTWHAQTISPNSSYTFRVSTNNGEENRRKNWNR